MSEANIALPALTNGQVMILWLIFISAFIGLGYGLVLVRTVMRADPGPKSMTDVADAIQTGAMAYMRRQVSTMIFFVIVIFFALFFMYRHVYHDLWLSLGISIAFLMGVSASYFSGFVGMWLAVKGNVRSANAALTSFKDSMELAFKAGGVSGMFTVGLGLLGATIIFLVYQQDAMKVLIGFGFGGSLAALFMRVGGGIYTQAADVGGDLVGKVEQDLPEDDPRNARRSRTTSATTSATAPEWQPISSSPTKSPWSPRSSWRHSRSMSPTSRPRTARSPECSR